MWQVGSLIHWQFQMFCTVYTCYTMIDGRNLGPLGITCKERTDTSRNSTGPADVCLFPSNLKSNGAVPQWTSGRKATGQPWCVYKSLLAIWGQLKHSCGNCTVFTTIFTTEFPGHWQHPYYWRPWSMWSLCFPGPCLIALPWLQPLVSAIEGRGDGWMVKDVGGGKIYKEKACMWWKRFLGNSILKISKIKDFLIWKHHETSIFAFFHRKEVRNSWAICIPIIQQLG